MWRKLSLSKKVNLVTATVVLLVTGFFESLDYARERRELLEVKAEELASIGVLAARMLRTPPAQTTSKELRSILSLPLGPLESIDVVDDGSVLVSSGEKEIELNKLDRISWIGDVDAWWTTTGLAVSVPFSHEAPTAKLFLQTSLVSVDELLGRTVLMHSIHGLAMVLALMAGVAWVLHKAVLGPLRQILSAMRAMERGTWETDVRAAYEDEVGDLTAAFNRMGRSLTRAVMQFVHAENLSTLALVANQLGRETEAPFEQMAEGATRLLTPGLPPREVEGEARSILAALERARLALKKVDRVFVDVADESSS